jgi:spore coat protein CotH
MGHPAPQHGYARVTVNGELFGLYSVVETVDDDFLERVFPGDDEGNLYEGGYGGDFREGCADLFDQKEGDDASLADLEALIDAVEASTPETFEALFDAHFDADAAMAMWAVELVSSNDDAYTTLANNYYAYHALEADQWTLVPWGADQAWRGDELLPTNFHGTLAQRCFDTDGCRARMKAHVEAVLDRWDAIDFASFAIEDIDAIEEDCRTDPRSEWGDYGCRDKLAELRERLRGRSDAVRAQLTDW